MENFEEPTKSKKVMKIVSLVLLVLLVLGSGASAYYYFDKSKKAKSEMESAKEAADSAKSELDSIEKSIAEKSDTGSTGTDDCTEELSDADTATIAEWDTYTSSDYDYTIKHPTEWTVNSSNANNVTITIAGDKEDSASMQIRTGTATEIGFAGYTLNSEDTTLVNCLDAIVNHYSVSVNGRVIVTNTIDSGKNFLFMFSYEYGGASQDADMIELNDLMIKTVEFE